MDSVRPEWLFDVASAFQRAALTQVGRPVLQALNDLRAQVPVPSTPLEQLIFDSFLIRAEREITTARGTRYGAALEERALELLHNRYADQLTYPIIGRELSCDPEYLEARFRKRTGQTIHSYLRCYRVSKALEKVRRGEKVEAAALECGFRSKSGFIRACRLLTGASPSACR